MQKQNILVMFGGVSCEHEISILTAVQLMNNISKSKYNIFPVYITKDGEMLLNNKFCELGTFKNKIPKKNQIYIKNGYIYKKIGNFLQKIYKKIDCAVLCFHGRNGEDGTIQGLLELNKIPYTSSNVLSSALTLNKDFSKKILLQNNVKIANYISLSKSEEDIVFEKMKQFNLNYPVIVKPNCLGSSIGVNKVNNKNELVDAISLAFNYDSVVLIEECIQPLMELNCACFKYKNEFVVSQIEQPLSKDEILTFADKYIKNNAKGTKGMKSLDRICPAKINKELEEKITKLTELVYRIFNCSGVARIDYLVNTQTNEVYVNELNSIPGSFAFYLYSNLGISYIQLIDMLIDNAIYEFTEKQKLLNSINNIVF